MDQGADDTMLSGLKFVFGGIVICLGSWVKEEVDDFCHFLSLLTRSFLHPLRKMKRLSA
jgi:hypothetical protein